MIYSYDIDYTKTHVFLMIPPDSITSHIISHEDYTDLGGDIFDLRWQRILTQI